MTFVSAYYLVFQPTSPYKHTPYPQIATGLSYKMPDNILLLTGALRWLMVPLLLMCVLPSDPIIPGEGVPIVVMSILGFTTGYMGSTPMCAASSQVAVEEREMAGET